MVAIIQQIQLALNSSENLSEKDLERLKIILKRYLSGEIKIGETYYDLLDSELVPMPSRCGMYSNTNDGTGDEEKLKSLINNKLLNK